MKKKYIPITIILIILFAAGACFFFMRKPQKGVTVIPGAVSGSPPVVYYLQKDEQWSGDKLGQSGYTMGGSGCLTSCIASALSIQAEKEGKYQSFTPGELNRLFSENGVYNDSGDIVWGKITCVWTRSGKGVSLCRFSCTETKFIPSGPYPG